MTSRGPIPQRRFRALLLSLTAAWPLAARAYRPFDETDAAVAARGEMEIEVGPGYLVEDLDRTLEAPSLVLNWGFAKRWEAVLEGRHLLHVGGAGRGPRSRVEDTALSAKTVLRAGSLQDRTGPSIATELAALLPTLHGDPGAGAEWALIVSQRWRDLTVHVNCAAAWTRARALAGFGGVILEGHDAWAVRPVAEVLVERKRGEPAVVSGLVGTIWRVSDALSLDGAVRLARAAGVRTTELRMGLTFGFGVGLPR